MNKGALYWVQESFRILATLPEKEKECLITTVDHFIKARKISLM